MSDKTRTYFASKDSHELAGVLQERREKSDEISSELGMKDRWRKSFRLYYGKHFTRGYKDEGSEITRQGPMGEYAAISINHYRNLIKHTLVLTTNQKPAFDVRAVNSDSDSLMQARLGGNILDAYMRTKRLGRYLKNTAEHAQVFGKGFIFVLWDPSSGREYGKKTVTDEDGQPMLDDDGQPKEKIVYEGDIEAHVPMPWHVRVDPAANDWGKLQWCEVTLFRNRFDLAEQYPQMADQILGLPSKVEAESQQGIEKWNQGLETDDVAVHYFIHKKTRGLPNGRYFISCSQDCVLFDGEAPPPYDKKLPLFRCVPGEIFDTVEGYSDAFDIIGIQEALNNLVSIAYTNQQANGIQKIWAPEGGNLTSTQLSKGLALLRSPPGTKPEPLQLTATAKEIFEMIPMLQKSAETTIGINSVARGDPDHSLKSGVALGLVQAMATQYASAFQQSWAELLEDVGTFIIDLLKEYAATTRMIALAGKKNKGSMASFSKDDMKFIDRVVVDLGNPLARTLAGRAQLADTYLEKGMIKTPQEYETVIETGQIDPLIAGSQADTDLIHKENDDLRDAKPVKAMVGDAHLLHAQEHRVIEMDPELRRKAAMGDPKASAIIEAATNHIMEHKQIYTTQDPFWSQIAGEPPAPPPPMPPPPMGGPGAPSGPQGGPPQLPPQGPPPGPPMPPPHGGGHGAPHGGPGAAQILAPPNQQAHIPRLPPNLQPGQNGQAQ